MATLHAPDGTVGEVWDVQPGLQVNPREGRPPLLPDDMTDGWLCFDSRGEKRRLYPIPERWEETADEALWRMCQDARPVRPDRIPPSDAPLLTYRRWKQRWDPTWAG